MLKNPFKKQIITREYQTLITNINSLEPHFKTLTDVEILTKSNQLQQQYQNPTEFRLFNCRSICINTRSKYKNLRFTTF